MKIFKPLLWGLFLCSYVVFGQIKNNDLTKLSYADLSDSFFDNEKNTTKQLYYANLYLKKALAEKNDIEAAAAYDFHSMIYNESDKEKALFYLDKSIQYSKNKNDSFYPMNAYWSKAGILVKQNKIEEAIDNYKKAEALALKSNNDFYYAIKINIGRIKSEYLGEVEEAIEIYKICHNFYKKKENKSMFPIFYRRTLFSMADAYKALHQTDSATYYNRLGYIDSKKNKDAFYQNLFTLNEGANLILIKKYSTAIDSINIAFPYIQKNADVLNKMACYYYYGKAYEGYGKMEIALKNFIKVDSIYQKHKDISPEFVSGYPFLIAYYKKVNNKEKQLLYTTTYMEIENDFQKKYKKFYNSIVKKYEIPNLLKDKNSELDSIKFLYRILVFCFITMSLFAGYQYYKKRLYKSRFKKIIVESEIWNSESNSVEAEKELLVSNTQPSDLKKSTKYNYSTNEDDMQTIINPNFDLTISQELINDLLAKLSKFESEHHFLQSGITIQNLSKEFGTNVKYLSKVVNYYKEKAFIHYINDLRIEYAIIKLQENKLLRQYTIESLAREFGFNSKDSFSNAFYKKTGIKPVFFVQELIKQNL